MIFHKKSDVYYLKMNNTFLKFPYFQIPHLQNFANFTKFLSQKQPKIANGLRVFFLRLVVNMLDYHFPLTVYLQLFEAGLLNQLKIEHKLKNSNLHSNCCYGALKLWYGFLFQKFTLDTRKQKSMTFETFFPSRSNEICSLVEFFSSFWAILVKFEIVYWIVTMATHSLRL